MAADSTTVRPSRSRERGSSHAHAQRAMFRLAAILCCWVRVTREYVSNATMAPGNRPAMRASVPVTSASSR